MQSNKLKQALHVYVCSNYQSDLQKCCKTENSKQPGRYFRNFNTVITANVFSIPSNFTKTMDPGCKQHSQLDKNLWSLANIRADRADPCSIRERSLLFCRSRRFCLGWRTSSLFTCLIQVKQQLLNCCSEKSRWDSRTDAFTSGLETPPGSETLCKGG